MNWYAKAIEIMHTGLTPSEAQEVAKEYAKKHPKEFVQAAGIKNGLWAEDEELASLIREGKFVGAVKRRREQTGEGLHVAKDYCHKIKEMVESDNGRN